MEGADGSNGPDAAQAVDAGPAAVDASNEPGAIATIDRNGVVCPGFHDALCIRERQDVMFGFGIEEMPRYEDDYVKGYERILSILSRKGPTEQFDQLHTEFVFQSDRPSQGSLWLVVAEPYWAAQDVLPDEVRLTFFAGPSDCEDWGDGHPYPARLVQSVLRDSTGALIATGGVAPLRADGSVIASPVDDLGLSLAWKDAGCKPCGLGEVNGGRVRRTVALQLSVPAEDTTVTALPGERHRTIIGGVSYVFSVELADVPIVEGRSGLCGSAFWDLYRESLLTSEAPPE